MTRGVVDQFIFGYGLFYDTWAPITESVIYICVAIVGGIFYGLEGILCGGIISQFIIVGIWKPYFLFSKGFQISVWKYWGNWIKYLVLIAIPFFTLERSIDYFNLQIYILNGWGHWVLFATSITIISSILYYIVLYIGTKGMRCFTKRIFKQIFK